MNQIAAIAFLLETLATLARQRNQGDIADRLDIIADGLVIGEMTAEQLGELRAEVAELVETGADPSPEQREAVRAIREDLKRRAQRMRDEGEDPAD